MDWMIIIFVIVFLLGLIATLIFLYIKRRNKAKLLALKQKEEKAKAELEHIRLRLNPHFVYNSLSGIQNLMNHNDVEQANAYLSKFARLTRNILDEKEVIAIQDEQKLLEDYLAMEGLRFKFNYEIRQSKEPNISELEIPSMLLQPFVENACKHSMSVLREKGNLLVAFKSEGKNLILSVQDNGEGFDTDKVYTGMGLMLCKKRIALLNQVYLECPISLSIKSGESGTTILITLNNWL